jgi:hypothetical protein
MPWDLNALFAYFAFFAGSQRFTPRCEWKMQTQRMIQRTT